MSLPGDEEGYLSPLGSPILDGDDDEEDGGELKELEACEAQESKTAPEDSGALLQDQDSSAPAAAMRGACESSGSITGACVSLDVDDLYDPELDTLAAAAAVRAARAHEAPDPEALREPAHTVGDLATALLSLARRLACPGGRVETASLRQQFAAWHRAVSCAPSWSKDEEHSVESVLAKLGIPEASAEDFSGDEAVLRLLEGRARPAPGHGPALLELLAPAGPGPLPAGLRMRRPRRRPPPAARLRPQPRRGGAHAFEAAQPQPAAGPPQALKLQLPLFAQGRPVLQRVPKSAEALRLAILEIVRACSGLGPMPVAALQARFADWYRSVATQHGYVCKRGGQPLSGYELPDVYWDVCGQSSQAHVAKLPFERVLRKLVAAYVYMEGSKGTGPTVRLPSGGELLTGHPTGLSRSVPSSIEQLRVALQGIQRQLLGIKKEAGPLAVLREFAAWLDRVGLSYRQSSFAPREGPRTSSSADDAARFLSLYRNLPGSRPELSAEDAVSGLLPPHPFFTGPADPAADQGASPGRPDLQELLSEFQSAPKTAEELAAVVRAAARAVARNCVLQWSRNAYSARCNRLNVMCRRTFSCFFGWHAQVSGVKGDANSLDAVHAKLTGRTVPADSKDILKESGADEVFRQANEEFVAQRAGVWSSAKNLQTVPSNPSNLESGDSDGDVEADELRVGSL
eukprot:tig00021070_g17914.t1